MTTPRPRRATRFAMTTAITAALLTIACVFAVLIASRYEVRLDATDSGTHTLAPRTRTTLESLDRPVRIVVSANLQRLDRASRLRLDDLLGAFADASPHSDIERIDTGRPGAIEAYGALVAELARREAPAIEDASTALRRAVDELTRLGAELGTLAQQCRTVGALIDNPGAGWREGADVLDQIASELDSDLTQARPLAETSFEGVVLPEIDAARAILQTPAEKATRALAALEAQAQRSDAGLSPEAVEARAEASAAAGALLQLGVNALDRLARAPRLDALGVARLLREREAIIVVGPERTVGVAFESLFPASGAEQGATTLRFAGEAPLASAIAAVVGAPQPAIILVHAETEAILENGRPTARFGASLGDLGRRLAQRRMTLAEWPVALDQPMPSRDSLALAPETPLVWFVLGGPLASAEDGFTRVTKLGEATRRLLDKGQSVLLTINPSDLPSVGEPNPLVTPLAPFGIVSDSGRLLISSVSTPGGPSYVAEHTVARANPDHPIGAAIDALATYLPTATPIELADPAPPDVRAWALLTIPASDQTWAEARWQSPPPSPDPTRDDLIGPWHVGVAAERHRPPTAEAALPGNRQRVVAIAASQWYVDRIMNARIAVEGAGGRTAAQFPGNRELLDASIAWLAGRDELIAPSSESLDVPRITALTPAQLSAIRWLLIAGLPALVLGVGAATRFLRR